MTFGTVKEDGHTVPANFILIIIFFDEAFGYGDGAKF
jgi:hypothetical protein